MFLFLPYAEVLTTVHKLIKSNICLPSIFALCLFWWTFNGHLLEFINVIQYAAWRRLPRSVSQVSEVEGRRRREVEEKEIERSGLMWWDTVEEFVVLINDVKLPDSNIGNTVETFLTLLETKQLFDIFWRRIFTVHANITHRNRSKRKKSIWNYRRSFNVLEMFHSKKYCAMSHKN
jgi:hypothetical protein